MVYLGAEWYLENYINTETKETYRINSFWHFWWYRGLLSAIIGDERIVKDFEILDSES